MKGLQNPRGQSQIAQPVELLDLVEQALEPHPTWVRSQPLDPSVISEQIADPTPCRRIEALEHVGEDAVVVGMPR